MTEKTAFEMRVIETEDGFRIELKGDKEELRRMIFDRERRFRGRGHRPDWRGFDRQHFGGHGPARPRPHQRGPHDHQHGPHDHHRGPKRKRGYDLGPWWDDGESRHDDTPIDA